MSKPRVAVALSGGVDSAGAALLLKRDGYEILGIHMRLADSPRAEDQANHAERVCHTLNIPFQVMDLRQEFQRYVVDYFCQEYQSGRTPNPCIACNQHVKLGILLDKVLLLDMDYLATGHYARISQNNNRRYHLLKGIDASKDQSYFLFTLTQERLSHILFPLGIYSKDEIQKMTKQADLPVAGKSSQDICFVSEKNYHAFLRERVPQMPGDIVDVQGKMLGRHQGIAFYTIGQRHGLGLAFGRPLYIWGIEPEHSRIILGEENELYSQKVIVKNLRWVSGMAPSEPIRANVKIRYKSKETAATVLTKGDAAVVLFSQLQWAVTPGQAIVFYRGEEILGGGIIESIKPIINAGMEVEVAAAES